MSELFEEKVIELKLDRSAWRLIKFGDVAIQQKGSVDRDNTELSKYIKGEHMSSEDLHLREWGELTDEYLGPAFIRKFQEGDILYGSRRTYLRKVAVAHFSGITSNTTFVIKANEAKIDKRLLPFVMLSEGFAEHSIRNSKGSVNPYVNWKDLADYEFLLPPKDQQTKLVELLWAMDGVVESELSVQLNLTMTRRCLMKRFQIGSANWHKNKLRDLMHFSYGKALKESDRIDGLFSVVSSAGIQGTHNEYLVNGPGIVVGRKGNAGEVIYIEKNFWPIDTAYFIEVKKDLKHIPIKFFYYLLQAADLKKHSIATAVPGLNRDDAMATKVYLPSEKEINLLTNEFEKIDQLLLEIDLKIESSKALQKSLINQIF